MGDVIAFPGRKNKTTTPPTIDTRKRPLRREWPLPALALDSLLALEGGAQSVTQAFLHPWPAPADQARNVSRALKNLAIVVHAWAEALDQEAADRTE